MMTILSVEGLTDGACECYSLMEKQFNSIFGQNWPDRVQVRERQEAD